MSMLSFESLKELKKVATVALPDLLLIPEKYALECIEYIKEQQTKLGHKHCEIIVLIDQSIQANISTVREWVSKGANSVWLTKDWETHLNERYGESEDSTGDERSKRYNGNQPITIAVGSTFRGAGSTHTALSIGKYLQKKYNAKVAIIECGKNAKDFSHIKLAGVGIDSSLQFSWEQITFICSGLDAKSLELATQNDQFDYVILDMGDLHQCEFSHMFFLSDLPILVGSFRSWRIASIYNILSNYSNYPQEDVRIVLSGSEADCKGMRTLFQERMVFSLPNQPDPMEWEDRTEIYYDKILSPILPIKRKHTSLSSLV